MPKTTKIASTVTARRAASAIGTVYTYDLTHPDGTTDTDLSRAKAIDILTDRYPRGSYDVLIGAFLAAEQEAYDANPDPLAEARAAALRNQLTTGRSYLARDE